MKKTFRFIAISFFVCSICWFGYLMESLRKDKIERKKANEEMLTHQIKSYHDIKFIEDFNMKEFCELTGYSIEISKGENTFSYMNTNSDSLIIYNEGEWRMIKW